MLPNLRVVVDLLRNNVKVEKLKQAIFEIFQNFEGVNQPKLYLKMDDKVENINPDVRNCIYKAIREAVTNGIKHGNASVFNIKGKR